MQAFVEVQIEGKKMLVQSEAAGKRIFGCEAVITKVEGNEALLEFDMKGPESVSVEMIAPVDDFEDPKKRKKMKGFNQINRTDLKRLLKFVGYKGETDEAGEEVQEETKAGGMIYSLNLAAGYRLMQTSLEISEDHLEFVHPDLLKNYMLCREGPEAGSGGSFLFVSRRLEGEQGWVREG